MMMPAAGKIPMNQNTLKEHPILEAKWCPKLIVLKMRILNNFILIFSSNFFWQRLFKKILPNALFYILKVWKLLTKLWKIPIDNKQMR